MRVAVLATLDTKGREAFFLVDRVMAEGCECTVVDVSASGLGDRGANATSEELVAAADVDLEVYLGMGKTGRLEVIVKGATRILLGAVGRGDVGGVVGIGGGQGTWICTGVMRALPLSVPKVMVSTVAHDAQRYLGLSNIMTVPSLTDMVGLNGLLKRTLSDCAQIICSVARGRDEEPGDDKSIGMTMFGVTTPGGMVAVEALGVRNYQATCFHANGRGGQVMEALAAEGWFVGVLDWTTTELIDEVVGGVGSAGSERLTMAGRLGIPQVVVPGALDVVNFGVPGSVPPQFGGRVFHAHTPTVTLMRSSAEECAIVGAVMAEALNAARGPVSVLIPTRGFSSLDCEGGPFWDPLADEAFVEALLGTLHRSINRELVAFNINDSAFAELAAERIVRMIENRSSERPE